MRISGSVEYNSKESIPYFIQINDLEVYSQGKTLKEAYDMILDVFGMLISEYTKGKCTKEDLTLQSKDGLTFDIVTSKIKEVSAFVIHRLRMFADLSQDDVVKNMGKTSRNSLASYEYAKSEAGLSKFQEILNAMGYDIKLSFVPKD